MSTTDFNNNTLEELITEEKKINNNRLLSGVFIGLMVGVLIYRLATRGFGLIAVAFPVAFILIFSNSMKTQNQNLTAIKKEIEKKRGAKIT